MDFHILIVIACVFLASLFSLIFINKIFRRKTFEEVIAEKKALSANLYAQSKASSAGNKKPKKKELKREKKQRQKEQQRDAVANTEQEDSDAQSEQPSVEDESTAPLTPPPGLSKTHVEFEPEPEVLTYSNGAEDKRRASNAEKENLNVGGNKLKNRKAGKNGAGAKSTVGILVNKNEPVAVKPTSSNVTEELNNFDVKPPKDVLELKKQDKEREKKEDKKKEDNNGGNKKDKNVKKDKSNVVEKITSPLIAAAVEQAVEVPHIAKDLLKQQQQEEKVRQGSPKTQHNATNNKTKQQQKKQQHQKDTASSTTKELVNALDKLSENETVGVSLFMKLFRRAELNRSEIQILIDYLLNKQQDMPASHSEWSDDICQKLKRQLEEKEKALAEEQEASIGIQAKLRELRTEINTERAQMNVNVKAYIDKLHSKEQELNAVNQELQQLNEKFAVERQQFQANLLREKQAGSQDLLAQLKLMQNEVAQREKVISELAPIVNASRQAVEESQQRNEIIQQQAQQVRTLEQQRDELEALQNNSIFELEKLKALETENAEIKVEIRNLQNALESAKVDLSQSVKELDAYKNELAHVRQTELTEKQKEIVALQAKNAELTHQLTGISVKAIEQTKEQTGLQVTVDALQQQLAVKEQQLANANAKQVELQTQVKQQLETTERQSTQQQQELQKLVEALKADVASKQTQLLAAQQAKELAAGKEKELLQQLNEQREKNNDLRMKNWKLVEALQNAEIIQQKNLNMQKKQTLTNANANVVQQEKLFAIGVQQSARNGGAPASAKDEQHLRALFQRLYPDAVKACAGSALSVSFEQWVEQVLAALVKQTEQQSSKAAAAASSSNKSTQSNSNNSSSNHHQQQQQQQQQNAHHNNSSSSNNINSNSVTSTSGESNSSSSANATEEQQDLYTQNLKLRRRIDGLTQIVTKTSNTLQELESRAREQEEHWRAIVRQKDDAIHRLQHSNGEQDI